MSRYVVHSLQDMVHCMLKILHTSRDQCLHCILFPKKESKCLEPGHLHKSLSGSGAQVISHIYPLVKPRQGYGFVVTSTFPSPFLAYCVDDIDHITGHKKERVWDMVTSTCLNARIMFKEVTWATPLCQNTSTGDPLVLLPPLAPLAINMGHVKMYCT